MGDVLETLTDGLCLRVCGPGIVACRHHHVLVCLDLCLQYKTVLDAIRARKERFIFEDVEIILRPTVMAFITMNPGYPGVGGVWEPRKG